MTADFSTLALIILKFLSLFGLGLYILFATVMLRQEQLMAQVLDEAFEPVLRFATIVHLLAAIAVFFLALLIL